MRAETAKNNFSKLRSDPNEECVRKIIGSRPSSTMLKWRYDLPESQIIKLRAEKNIELLLP